MTNAQALEKATFAGGCFWCLQSEFNSQKGVTGTSVGYTGGHADDPSYQEVVTGETGHYEAIQVTYDPAQVSYDTLLDIFWSNVDPLDDGGQFCDRGQQYSTAVFYHSDEQLKQAEASKKAKSEMLGAQVVTKLVQADAFYDAEDYHQNYYAKNPLRYKLYRYGCGRDQLLQELWDGKKS